MKENKLWEKSPFWQPSTKKIIYNFPTGNVQVLWVSGFFLAFSLSLTFSSSSLVSQSAALTLGWQKLDTSTEEWSFLHWSGSRWEPTIWKVHFETGINFLQHALCLIFSVRWELAPQRVRWLLGLAVWWYLLKACSICSEPGWADVWSCQWWELAGALPVKQKEWHRSSTWLLLIWYNLINCHNFEHPIAPTMCWHRAPLRQQR